MRVLGLSPARGGSKGILRKNLRFLAGKPLIAWSIEAALACAVIERVVVSTDDQEIAEVSVKWGADVPFIRPPQLARDETPGIDVVRHALGQLPEFDTVVLLQPTSPLRTANDIDTAVALYIESGRRHCIAVSDTVDPPHWSFYVEGTRLRPVLNERIPLRRQDLPRIVIVNGAIYVADTQRLLQSGSFLEADTVPYFMSREGSIDIDTEFDLQFCEFLIRNANPCE
jgi:N-acylneuraminate cytidylyltransferase